MNKNKINNTIITHWNCNSINNKIEEFKLFLNTNKPDIISLNEIKNIEIKANFLFNKINNYSFIHKHRENNKNGGGGVAILIKNNFKFATLNIFDHLNLEILCIKVKISSFEMLFISFTIHHQKSYHQKFSK
jgi:exonuclease III